MAAPRRLAIVRALTVAAVTGVALPAMAHQTSIKYVDVTLEGRGARVELTVAPGDTTDALGLPADARPSVAQASTPAVARAVAGWLAIGPDGGAPCRPDAPTAQPGGDGRFVVVAWRVACDDALGALALDFTRFF